MENNNKKKQDDEFIENLVATNREAGVDESVIELITGYARLCLKSNEPVKFYSAPPLEKIKSKYPLVRQFIRKNNHLDASSLEFLSNYANLLRASKLPIIFNKDQLANYLSTSSERLAALSRNADSMYRVFSIPKASGGLRWINEPEPELKVVQSKILKGILENVPLHPAATAFRRKRSISNNAESHINKKVVARLDIKDFFPSIPFVRVQAVFLNFGYPKSIAQTLAQLTTYKQRLPMGAPTSPYLSNIVAGRLDRRFEKLCDNCGFSYTRYADDLIFSGIDNSLKSHIPIFNSIIESEGFVVNKEKLKVMSSGAKQKVTGVVTNKKINIDRAQYRQLRAVLHNCCSHGVSDQMTHWGAKTESSFKNQLIGHINFVRMLNPEKANKLLVSFKKIQWSA